MTKATKRASHQAADPRGEGADGWLEAGLEVLRDQGPEALTIERLGEVMGKTKGAFYHHFEGVEDLRRRLLERWRDRLTLQPIALVERAGGTAQQRAHHLRDLVRGMDQRLDCAVRAWSLRDPAAARSVAEVDRARVACLASFHADAGSAQAPLLGLLEYVLFVGMQHLHDVVGDTQAHALEALVLQLARRSP